MNFILYGLVVSFSASANSLNYGSGEIIITDEISGSGEAQITDYKNEIYGIDEIDGIDETEQEKNSDSRITFIVDLDENMDTEIIETKISKNKSPKEKEESCDAEDDLFEELEPVLENDIQLEELEDLDLESIHIETTVATTTLATTSATTSTTTSQISTTTELARDCRDRFETYCPILVKQFPENCDPNTPSNYRNQQALDVLCCKSCHDK